jgi:tetratricopeptide (TPR) repeat protein
MSAGGGAFQADEGSIRDLDMAFYERRAKDDPWSAADRVKLAGLYLQRARETGSFTDYGRAESLSVKALQLRQAHNEEAYTILGSARLARHDFVGALAAARSLVERSPEEPRYRALLGEVLLELGRYDEASTVFKSLESETGRLSVAARLVRWYEMTGRLDQAKHVAGYALRRAVEEKSLTREQEAWFHLRLGELELKSGALEGADSLFARGLEVFPTDYRLLGARARAAALRGDWRGAIEHGNAAIAIQLDPTTLGVLSDAYAALGDSSQAASVQRAMRASALTQPGTIHRAWGLFLLDHGMEADEVLRRVRRELESRRDVYGYDLAAWASHALGHNEEGWKFMRKALSQGTEDALLWYHAAVIARARGDNDQARALLGRALLLNERFHPTLAWRARALRDSLWSELGELASSASMRRRQRTPSVAGASGR